MGRNVFVSFRFNDGLKYKEKLCEILKENISSYNYYEDIDRSDMSDDTIRHYLYNKLKESGVVIILLTPNALEYKRKDFKIDDWCYDEVRYALQERFNNSTKGLIAVYVPEVENEIITKTTHICNICKKESSVTIVENINHLFRKNMMNVKPEFKKNKCNGIYDSMFDSYCSLVSFNDFCNDLDFYIENAYKKKEEVYKYNLCKELK